METLIPQLSSSVENMRLYSSKPAVLHSMDSGLVLNCETRTFRENRSTLRRNQVISDTGDSCAVPITVQQPQAKGYKCPKAEIRVVMPEVKRTSQQKSSAKKKSKKTQRPLMDVRTYEALPIQTQHFIHDWTKMRKNNIMDSIVNELPLYGHPEWIGPEGFALTERAPIKFGNIDPFVQPITRVLSRYQQKRRMHLPSTFTLNPNRPNSIYDDDDWEEDKDTEQEGFKAESSFPLSMGCYPASFGSFPWTQSIMNHMSIFSGHLPSSTGTARGRVVPVSLLPIHSLGPLNKTNTISTTAARA